MNLKRWQNAFVIVSMIVAVGGCGDDDTSDTNPNNNPADDPQSVSASFESYNVGLARGFVPEARARLQPVAEAVESSPADVMCVQEAWLVQNDQDEWVTDQIDTIVDQASSAFGSSYYHVTETAEQVSCTQREAAPVQSCAVANCSEVSADDLATCALDNCSDQINALPDACQSCVFGQIGNPLDEIIDTCTGGGASAFSYNGHNGLLMLSRHELRDTEFTTFDSTIVQRAALHAVVGTPDFGDVDVYCTHLAANLSDVPYPSDTYEGYEQEQAAQIDALNTWVEQTSSTDTVVVMGDMNAGPAKDGLDAEFGQNYQIFVDAGYRDPYLAQQHPKCTYCGSNTLNDGQQMKVLDHIFVDAAQTTEATGVERVYDEPVDIQTSGGSTESINLSDHYGIKVTLDKPAP